MEAPDPRLVSTLLMVLAEARVSKFKCPAFEVEFLPPEVEPPRQVSLSPKAVSPVAAAPRHPGYAAAFGGNPPKFTPATEE